MRCDESRERRENTTICCAPPPAFAFKSCAAAKSGWRLESGLRARRRVHYVQTAHAFVSAPSHILTVDQGVGNAEKWEVTPAPLKIRDAPSAALSLD
jgi:hypothetical protein